MIELRPVRDGIFILISAVFTLTATATARGTTLLIQAVKL